jgi:hypothetical protein
VTTDIYIPSRRRTNSPITTLHTINSLQSLSSTARGRVGPGERERDTSLSFPLSPSVFCPFGAPSPPTKISEGAGFPKTGPAPGPYHFGAPTPTHFGGGRVPENWALPFRGPSPTFRWGTGSRKLAPHLGPTTYLGTLCSVFDFGPTPATTGLTAKNYP